MWQVQMLYRIMSSCLVQGVALRHSCVVIQFQTYVLGPGQPGFWETATVQAKQRNTTLVHQRRLSTVLNKCQVASAVYAERFFSSLCILNIRLQMLCGGA